MSRPLRIEFPGAVYHVTSRGNAKQKIFLDNSDRSIFLSILFKTIKRSNWLCHSYCLMDNHYHFIIETPDGNLSEGMRQLNGTYAQYFNHNHERVGHLFQGRFKSILIEKESYLLELSRYIVLNPIRAGFVKHPEDYIWSNYRQTAGIYTDEDSLLETDWLLMQFGADRATAHCNYTRFVNEGFEEKSPLEKVQGQIILGGKDFIESLSGYFKESIEMNEIPKEQRFVTRLPLETILFPEVLTTKAIRNAAIYKAHTVHAYTRREIAKHLGLHVVTIGRIVECEMAANKKKR